MERGERDKRIRARSGERETCWNKIDLSEQLERVGLLEEEEQVEAEGVRLQVQSVDHVAEARSET
jgi:hypothetical protein